MASDPCTGQEIDYATCAACNQTFTPWREDNGHIEKNVCRDCVERFEQEGEWGDLDRDCLFCEGIGCMECEGSGVDGW